MGLWDMMMSQDIYSEGGAKRPTPGFDEGFRRFGRCLRRVYDDSMDESMPDSIAQAMMTLRRVQ